MRDDFEITAPTVDLAQRAAIGAGALGARMTGGGFGGCVIALVQATGAQGATAVRSAVERAFGAASFGTPECFVATASSGAHPC